MGCRAALSRASLRRLFSPASGHFGYLSAMTNKTAADVFFYHLQRQPLEQVLPVLVEKTLAKGWRAIVQVGSEERLSALDQALWTYSDDSFLAHGTAKTGFSADQPVYLTMGEENPNGAGVKFLVDGATVSDFAGYERVVYVFDGGDEAALNAARQQWKAAKAAGAKVTYWQQSEQGRWEQKA